MTTTATPGGRGPAGEACLPRVELQMEGSVG
jgi:hypothetical protein